MTWRVVEHHEAGCRRVLEAPHNVQDEEAVQRLWMSECTTLPAGVSFEEWIGRSLLCVPDRGEPLRSVAFVKPEAPRILTGSGSALSSDHVNSLMGVCIENAGPLVIAQLKSNEPYPVACPRRRGLPRKPTLPQAKPEPRLASIDANRNSVLERLLSRLSRQRREAAEAEHDRELARWKAQLKQWEKQHEEMLELFADRICYWCHWSEQIRAQDDGRIAAWARDEACWRREQQASNRSIEELAQRYGQGEPDAIAAYAKLVLLQSPYPAFFPRNYKVRYQAADRCLRVEMELANLLEMTGVVRRGSVEAPVSVRVRRRLHEQAIFSVVLRSLYELVQADAARKINRVVLNGFLRHRDLISQEFLTTWVLAVNAPSGRIVPVAMECIDPREALLRLGMRASKSMCEPNAVEPILDEEESKQELIPESSWASIENAAAVSWERFEHLVKELFERELGPGAQISVTRPRGDGGVDVIALDPDPIRGGKFLIQAKRYKHGVPLEAVRDLYGTMMSEGASRGILVTTSHFTKAGRRFAANKPLTLIGGEQLVELMRKHGMELSVSNGGRRALHYKP